MRVRHVKPDVGNAYFFHRFSGRFDVRRAHLAGAALFLVFGLDTVRGIATGVSIREAVASAVPARV